MSENLLANFEGKLDSTGELGESCQKESAAAELRVVLHKGAASAMATAAKNIRDQLEKLLKKEVADGAFAKCKTPGHAQDWVQKTIERAVGFCEHFAAISKNNELLASGEAVALHRMTELIGKHNDTAVSRIRQIQAGEVPSDPKVDGKGNPRRRPGEAPLSVPAMAAVKAKAKADKEAAEKPGKKSAKKKAAKKKAAKKSAKKKAGKS